MSPCRSTTGSPLPRSIQPAAVGNMPTTVPSSRSSTDVREHSLHRFHARATQHEKADQAADLNAKVAGHLARRPGPGDVRARVPGLERPAQIGGGAAPEARDPAAEVPDVVRVAAA